MKKPDQADSNTTQQSSKESRPPACGLRVTSALIQQNHLPFI